MERRGAEAKKLLWMDVEITKVFVNQKNAKSDNDESNLKRRESMDVSVQMEVAVTSIDVSRGLAARKTSLET
jgi:hypothetical protein